jgi:hypothetical protein
LHSVAQHQFTDSRIHLTPPLTSAPSVKAYGELPENAKINETDNFGEEDGECTFEFGDDEEVDIDDI